MPSLPAAAVADGPAPEVPRLPPSRRGPFQPTGRPWFSRQDQKETTNDVRGPATVIFAGSPVPRPREALAIFHAVVPPCWNRPPRPSLTLGRPSPGSRGRRSQLRRSLRWHSFPRQSAAALVPRSLGRERGRLGEGADAQQLFVVHEARLFLAPGSRPRSTIMRQTICLPGRQRSPRGCGPCASWSRSIRERIPGACPSRRLNTVPTGRPRPATAHPARSGS